MSEVVVIRPMQCVLYAKCPFCNLEAWLDRSGTFYQRTQFRCEGCGAFFGEQTIGIQTLRSLVDSDALQDNDITTMLAQSSSQQLTMVNQPSPVLSMKIQRSALYVASAICPFCNQTCIMRYNALQPHVAQWCPECHAELVVTIWATMNVGGNLEEWYHPTPEEL